MRNSFLRLMAAFWVLSYSGGVWASGVAAVFTLQAPKGQWIVRAITYAPTCPGISWDGQVSVPMQLRVQQGTVPVRSDVAQSDSKPSVFDVSTCEVIWPTQAKSARIEGQAVPAPPHNIQRILIVADTGCRLKASENAFQDCNDADKWPWTQVAQSAAQRRPDLVVHIGDIHYRESPCPSDHKGCAGATWGYGWDAWRDDFFKPAAPLLASAPWLFVRGNHESCYRAGQGWFRFVDALPWSVERSCNDPADDMQGDFSEPFAAAVSERTQFIVFDSSKSSGKPYKSTDPAFVKYQAQMKSVAELTKLKPENFFINHHPLLAAAPGKDPHVFKPAGSGGLQSAFASIEPDRLFPSGVSVTMHGHVHLFEALSFQSDHPVSLVMGNSGSMNEGFAPHAVTPSDRIYKEAVVDDYASRSEYGFATLDRMTDAGKDYWQLTEYTPQGQAVIQCRIQNNKSRCQKLALK
jgi:predicted esterase